RGGAPIDRRQPTGIAVGEHVDALAVFTGGNALNDLKPVPTDGLVDGDILVGDLASTAQGGGGPLRPGTVAHRSLYFVDSPFEIDRSWPGGDEHSVGVLQGLVGRIGTQGKPHPVGGSRPYQRRPAHLHCPDRAGHVRYSSEP